MLDDDPARVFGFDTGPANAPLDRLARSYPTASSRAIVMGKLARAGRVNEPLLTELLADRPLPGASSAEIDRIRDVR